MFQQDNVKISYYYFVYNVHFYKNMSKFSFRSKMFITKVYTTLLQVIPFLMLS